MELESVGAGARPISARQLQALVVRVQRAAQRFDRLEHEVRVTRDELRLATEALLEVVPGEQQTTAYMRVRLACPRCGIYERSIHINDMHAFERKPECPCCHSAGATVTPMCRTGGATVWERLSGAAPSGGEQGFVECDEPDCHESATVKGKCGRHYMRAWRASRRGETR